MSNDFFNHSANRVPKGVTARSKHINDVADEIAAGFDQLPSERELKENRAHFGTDTGAADAYVITSIYPATAYSAGMQTMFIVSVTNTGDSTINVDSLGVKPVKQPDGSAITAGTLTSGQLVNLVYDGTNFVVREADVAAAQQAASDAIAAAAGVNLPSITAGDAGKRLSVNAGETGYQLDTVYDLPAPTVPRKPVAVNIAGDGYDEDPGWTIIVWTTTLVSFGRYWANTSGGAFTVTLPASPAAGDRIDIGDYGGNFGAKNLTVARNGKNIMGLAEDLIVSTNNAVFSLVYVDAGEGWRLI